MGENNNNTFNSSQQDIFNDLRPSSSDKLEEEFSSSASIQPAQKAPAKPVSWSAQIQKKTASDFRKDKAEKYAQYFKENEILLMLVGAVKPKTLSFVFNDLRPTSKKEALKTF